MKDSIRYTACNIDDGRSVLDIFGADAGLHFAWFLHEAGARVEIAIEAATTDRLLRTIGAAIFSAGGLWHQYDEPLGAAFYLTSDGASVCCWTVTDLSRAVAPLHRCGRCVYIH